MERMRSVMAQTNFGFEKVERLAGNIGYLDLRGFLPPQMMGDTAAAAMTFLANANALIIDLRENGGGSPDAVTLLFSVSYPPAGRNLGRRQTLYVSLVRQASYCFSCVNRSLA
jgi:C-terminal processing protease CtpA/Prc